MKNRTKQTENGTGPGDLRDHFADSEKKEVEKIWQLTKRDRPGPKTSSEEVETALQNVHHRIRKKNKTPEKSPATIAGSVITYSRYLVAAVALIALGFGYVMIPKTVSVPHGEISMFELPDGSTIEMNSGTTIRYNRLFSLTNRSLTLNGEAYFAVEPGDDPFIVEANGSATEVTGTEFNVRSWQDDPKSETTITVTEGTVRFYPEGNQSNSVSLQAGQTSRWNAGLRNPEQPKTASTETILAWRENRMVFQETPFIVILNDLERSFDVTIELDVAGMEMETLTAYYTLPANIESILEDLCTVKGLRYTKTSNGYRIFK